MRDCCKNCKWFRHWNNPNEDYKHAGDCLNPLNGKLTSSGGEYPTSNLIQVSTQLDYYVCDNHEPGELKAPNVRMAYQPKLGGKEPPSTVHRKEMDAMWRGMFSWGPAAQPLDAQPE
jgi:hypothetical protein